MTRQTRTSRRSHVMSGQRQACTSQRYCTDTQAVVVHQNAGSVVVVSGAPLHARRRYRSVLIKTVSAKVDKHELNLKGNRLTSQEAWPQNCGSVGSRCVNCDLPGVPTPTAVHVWRAYSVTDGAYFAGLRLTVLVTFSFGGCMQRQIFKFHRAIIRTAREKEPELRTEIMKYAREQFDINKSIDRKDVMRAQFLRNQGGNETMTLEPTSGFWSPRVGLQALVGLGEVGNNKAGIWYTLPAHRNIICINQCANLADCNGGRDDKLGANLCYCPGTAAVWAPAGVDLQCIIFSLSIPFRSANRRFSIIIHTPRAPLSHLHAAPGRSGNC
eukprot:1194018-Prorocentrum_minimum.AAC.3